MTETLYAGFSRARLSCPRYDLGGGLVLQPTYAHLMSPCIVAFSPPDSPGKPHGAPWKAASGGFGYDIHFELHVPRSNPLAGVFSPEDVSWLVAALLRLAHVPYLTVPVLSDQPFRSVLEGGTDPSLTPFEIEPRIVAPPEESSPTIPEETLLWVRDHWLPCGHLFRAHPRFHDVFRAFDSATLTGRPSSALLAIWGGLEQLFSPSAGELRFRVASLIASYMAPYGPERHALYKRILSLYNERSSAAHTSSETSLPSLVESYVLLRNVLVRIVDENALPTQEMLEALLLGRPGAA